MVVDCRRAAAAQRTLSQSSSCSPAAVHRGSSSWRKMRLPHLSCWPLVLSRVGPHDMCVDKKSWAAVVAAVRQQATWCCCSGPLEDAGAALQFVKQCGSSCRPEGRSNACVYKEALDSLFCSLLSLCNNVVQSSNLKRLLPLQVFLMALKANAIKCAVPLRELWHVMASMRQCVTMEMARHALASFCNDSMGITLLCHCGSEAHHGRPFRRCSRPPSRPGHLHSAWWHMLLAHGLCWPESLLR